MNNTERIFRSITSFRSKQRLMIMLACSIVQLVTLLCFFAYSYFSINLESRERLGSLSDIIGADIGAALAFGDNQAVIKSIAALRADPSIKELFVLNENDQISAYYYKNMDVVPDDVQQRLKNLQSEVRQSLFELSPGVERPIIRDGIHLGTILIEQDDYIIINKLAASAGISIFILLFSLGFSYLLADRFQRVITKPVTAMATTMQEVSLTKDYSKRVATSGTDEMDQLAERFNEMLGEIAQRDEDILESEYRWKFALEGSGDGVWDWNIQTDEVKYSSRWKEMLWYAEDDILATNKEWVDRIHPDDQSYVLKTMQAYLDGKSETYVVEYRLKCQDDSYKWILGRGMVVSRSEDGKPLRLIGTHTDITERKQAEKELQKKNAEIEQFLYTVSHDLRSPLVTVKTFLGFLENDMVGNDQERIAKDLQYIHSAADKMRLLLDELLELSRIDRSGNPPSRVSLMEIVAEVLDVMAGVIKERKVDIHLPGADLILFGDRQRLSQIWQNLIENAIKYSLDGSIPRIVLGIQQMSGETVFFVKDKGIGIDPQYQSKIFGIFEKLDPKSSGAGLGLSMIQRIVEKNNGRIWVESEGTGKGSCFFFTLPLMMVQS